MTNTKAQPSRQMLDDQDLEAVAGGVPTPWGPRPSEDVSQPQAGKVGEAFRPIYVGPCPNPDANG